MKELTIEEKARAYDEAIRIAQELYNNHNSSNIGKGYVCTVFPELQESEDERVRESLLEYLHTLPNHYSHSGVCAPEWIAWIEKQDKKDVRQKFLEDLLVADDIYQMAMNDAMVEEARTKAIEAISKIEISQLLGIEKHGEQKPTDKVKPKFHKGEWITNDDYTWKILDVKPLDYILQSQDGNIVDDTISHINEQFHSFTIEDAKPGDVLFQDLMGGKVFIYNGVTPDTAILYSFIISNDGEELLPYNIGKPNTGIGTIEDNKNIIYPATKEQCDHLFSKMKEAGYEWNAEKKELKKFHVIDEGKSEMDYCFTKMMNGEKVSSAWSEEDEQKYKEWYDFIRCFVEQRIDKFTHIPSNDDIYKLDDNILKHAEKILNVK